MLRNVTTTMAGTAWAFQQCGRRVTRWMECWSASQEDKLFSSRMNEVTAPLFSYFLSAQMELT